MLLQFTSQILVSLGLIRLLAAGLEALLFARWHLKESGKNIALYYWMVFHTIAAWCLVLTVFRYAPFTSLGNAISFGTFALLIYVLMFVVPPYRSKIGLGFKMIEEIEAKKPQEATRRLISLMQRRGITAICGIGAFFLLLIFRMITKTNDIFVMTLNLLYSGIGWIYWAIAGVSTLFCLISAYFGIQILYSDNRQRVARRRMESQLGKRLTDEEFMYKFVEEQKKQQK